MSLLFLALSVSGVFSLTLGVVHFAFPILLDFDRAIPRNGASLKPFRLGPIRYATQRSDVYGIAWVMNHAASYTLVGVGLADLTAFWWIEATAGHLLALWIAGWWFVRAGSQLYLGRRRGDWWILAGFSLLGIVHLLAALFASLG